jgi:hypothetical protein
MDPTQRGDRQVSSLLHGAKTAEVVTKHPSTSITVTVTSYPWVQSLTPSADAAANATSCIERALGS